MRPNGLWILLPVLFGLIGGIIAYLGILNNDKDLAKELLKIGGFVTALWIIIPIVIFLLPYTDFF
ncbi:MAG: hypothetical protein QQN58_05965 [Nitrosopumilus sp.]|nr:hypothetical protein [Nitrososphaerota archaeon]MCH9042079.1 hypothetical protein [Nitrososphaerota archaeon]